MSSQTILIAEDESHLLKAMSGSLRDAGYDVLTARDGGEALSLARSERPDLIVADYQMPRLSGLELCRRLRQSNETSAIPAIMLTAEGYDIRPQDVRASGIRLMIAKPVSPRQLLAAVNQALAARELP